MSTDDTEKAYDHDVHIDNASLSAPGVPAYNIDPVVEKRVIRKLDLHVVPLLMTLCKWRLFANWWWWQASKQAS